MRFTDADGHRFTAFLTDTTSGQLPDIEVHHRSYARVEDRIRCGKATGLRNFPCRGYAENKTWLELALTAADLLTTVPAKAGHHKNFPRTPKPHARSRLEQAPYPLEVLGIAEQIPTFVTERPNEALMLGVLTDLAELPPKS